MQIFAYEMCSRSQYICKIAVVVQEHRGGEWNHDDLFIITFFLYIREFLNDMPKSSLQVESKKELNKRHLERTRLSLDRHSIN